MAENVIEQITQAKETAPKAKEQHVPSTPEKSDKQKQVEAMEAEIKALELEEKRLNVAFQKANLTDMEERLAERELKRANIRQEAYTKGATLDAIKRNEEKQQSHCNHKKGGNGAQGVVGGQGDDSQYAVLKHTFANGDMWIRCLRCGKTWKPPVKSDHKTAESYEAAAATYKEAVNFQTRNVPSKGVIFQYGDGGIEMYRENTKNANLR